MRSLQISNSNNATISNVTIMNSVVSDNHLMFFSHVYDLNLTDSLISNVTGTDVGVGDLRAIFLDSILPKSD